MWERKAQTPDTERRAELLIDVQRMSKIYNEGRENEVRALDDISLQVQWGSSCAFWDSPARASPR